MYTDIFRFNLTNLHRNIIILIILLIVIQKYFTWIRSIGIVVCVEQAKRLILLSLIIGIIPYRTIIQGGINIYHLIFIGLVYVMLRNYISYKRYKIIPPSPVYIIPLIVAIEFVRLIIRPLSLILRIGINLSIGHIVIYILIYPFSILYNIIEIFVYIIQIYIFWSLITIYRY